MDGMRMTATGARRAAAAALMALAAALAGCNQAGGAAPQASAPSGQPEGVGVSPVTPSGFRLPEGGGCAGELARFRAVMQNDLATGHVARSVYDRVTAEISAADARCAAGDTGGALAALRATKTRFGYP